MYIFGILEDSTGLFVLSKLFNLLNTPFLDIYGYPFGINTSIFNISEPLYFLFYFLVSTFIDPIHTYNFFNFITLVLILYTAYKLYFYIFENSYISTILSFLSVINPYVIYHLRSHPQLIQIWIVMIFLYYISKNNLFIVFRFKNYVISGVILSLIFLFSNYLGFFTYILFAYFFLVHILISLYQKNYKVLLQKFKYFSLMIFSSFIVLIIALGPYFYSLYNQTNTNSEINGNIPTPFNRPLEDFITFSSRPWYFLLPSIDNPYYGSFSKDVIYFLQTQWGNYLAQNYFKSEHSSLFLGFTNILTSIIGLFYLRKKIKSTNLNILILISSIPFLFLVSLPPIVILGEFKIYGLSYFIWLFLPMFRVLSRLGIIIFLLYLALVGFGYSQIFNILKKPTSYLVVLILFLLSIGELYVPLKLTYVGTIPNSIYFLKNNISVDSVIATYPYNKANYVFFWQREHAKKIMNPKGYFDIQSNFDSEKFTKNLVTCEGVIKAIDLGMTHLVNYEPTEDFFENQKFLKLVKKGIDLEYTNKSNILITYETANISTNFYIYQLDSTYNKDEIAEYCIEL